MTVKIDGQISRVPALYIPSFLAFLKSLTALHIGKDGGVYQDSQGTMVVVLF
jgi:hypothetical protein